MLLIRQVKKHPPWERFIWCSKSHKHKAVITQTNNNCLLVCFHLSCNSTSTVSVLLPYISSLALCSYQFIFCRSCLVHSNAHKWKSDPATLQWSMDSSTYFMCSVGIWRSEHVGQAHWNHFNRTNILIKKFKKTQTYLQRWNNSFRKGHLRIQCIAQNINYQHELFHKEISAHTIAKTVNCESLWECFGP